MRIFRQHRGLFASLAGLAMLAHVLAAAFCPNMSSHRSGNRYFDSVLGWVTLCLPSSLGNGSGRSKLGGDQGTTSDHTGMCAALCAAVVAAVTAFVALVLAIVFTGAAAQIQFNFISRRSQRHNLFGGIGSRAPPALI
jgi:hypothetical protein